MPEESRVSKNKRPNGGKKKFIIALAMLVVGVLIIVFVVSNSSKKESESSQHSVSLFRSSSKSSKASSSVKTNRHSSSKAAASSSTNTETSYAVDAASLAGKSFTIKGVNTPSNFDFTSGSGSNYVISISYQQYPDSAAPDIVNATIQSIPTKQVRVFSHGNNAIRTVKVDTAVTINSVAGGNQDGASKYVGNVAYLFYNKQGGMSLATPNYAGNVPSEYNDVMLEYTD
ncbi:hypothetical protein [Paucilactobacillus nenjiangensis]|uniref:hypothetical protein n=1 Tax=Paucilactobacillus nenjiangensis TaxID=1296540 RepID=UPI0010F85D56|nr:hypothetical protein [Paucilactobacillus nenjiangensis]